MLRILTTLFVLSLVLITNFSDAHAKGNPKYASIVMDADTGMILSQRYADKKLHPASLTKMMTMLLTFEALDRGLIKKRDRIRISRHAASMQPSKLGLAAGQKIRVEDAIYALATKSANDISVALAEHLGGGSERKFAMMMTERARTIGMHKTRFKNASGLHHKHQVSTARDMAKMARYILKRYPHYYRYFSTKSFTYRGKTYRNHNRLMDSYKGMDGFKTGYINASGFNLVASAYRNHRRLIGVVFGGRTTKSRNKHMASLLDAGFKKSGQVRIASLKRPPVPTSKPLYGVATNTNTSTTTIAAVKKMAPPARFTSLAALNSKHIRTAQKKYLPSNVITPDYTALTKALQEGAFGNMLGQGDFDPAASKRLETGLIAIAVHKGIYQPNPEPPTAIEKSLRNVGHAMISKIGQNKRNTKEGAIKTITPLVHPKDVIGKWAIQIGAYNSRVATDEALRSAKEKLPKKFSQAKPIMIPLRTKNGIIFRARLGNLTQSEALETCKYFKNCMPIAPITTTISAR